MRFRLDSQTGPAVPTLDKALELIHSHLAAQQALWAEQLAPFSDRATIDMDGTPVPTMGACKAGMDIAYDGTRGYHPLVVSLAEIGQVLRLLNRSGVEPLGQSARSSKRAKSIPSQSRARQKPRRSLN